MAFDIFLSAASIALPVKRVQLIALNLLRKGHNKLNEDYYGE